MPFMPLLLVITTNNNGIMVFIEVVNGPVHAKTCLRGNLFLSEV